MNDADPLARSIMSRVVPREVRAELRLGAPVVIGQLTVENMPVFVADQRHFENVDMLLGYDFVTPRACSVSRSSGTIVMQYPPQATPIK